MANEQELGISVKVTGANDLDSLDQKLKKVGATKDQLDFKFSQPVGGQGDFGFADSVKKASNAQEEYRRQLSATTQSTNVFRRAYDGITGLFTGFWGGARQASGAAEGLAQAQAHATSSTHAFRQALRAANPILYSFGGGLQGLGMWGGAAKAGLGLLAVAIGTTFIVSLEKASDRVRLLRERLNSITGSSQEGGAALERYRQIADRTGDDVTTVARNIYDFNRKLSASLTGFITVGGGGTGASKIGQDFVAGLGAAFQKTGIASDIAAQKISGYISKIGMLDPITQRASFTLADMFEEVRKDSPEIADLLIKAFRTPFQGPDAERNRQMMSDWLRSTPQSALQLTMAMQRLNEMLKGLKIEPTVSQNWVALKNAASELWDALGKSSGVATALGAITKVFKEWTTELQKGKGLVEVLFNPTATLSGAWSALADQIDRILGTLNQAVDKKNELEGQKAGQKIGAIGGALLGGLLGFLSPVPGGTILGALIGGGLGAAGGGALGGWAGRQADNAISNAGQGATGESTYIQRLAIDLQKIFGVAKSAGDDALTAVQDLHPLPGAIDATGMSATTATPEVGNLAISTGDLATSSAAATASVNQLKAAIASGWTMPRPQSGTTQQGTGWSTPSFQLDTGQNVQGTVGYATGGAFIVGGTGGVDQTPIRFMATRGEIVTITPSGLQSPIGMGAGLSSANDNFATVGAAGGAVQANTASVSEITLPITQAIYSSSKNLRTGIDIGTAQSRDIAKTLSTAADIAEAGAHRAAGQPSYAVQHPVNIVNNIQSRSTTTNAGGGSRQPFAYGGNIYGWNPLDPSMPFYRNTFGPGVPGFFGGGGTGALVTAPDFTPAPQFGLQFAEGGSFMVGGPAGRDKTPVRFMASRGERVDITPANGNARRINDRPHITNVNVYGVQSPEAFIASTGAIRRSIRRMARVA